MTAKNTKTPAKTPAKARKPAAKPNAEAEAKAAEGLVQPLRKESLGVLLEILDNTPIKGAQARTILELKRELYTVANVQLNG